MGKENNRINLTKRRWLVLLASCLINLCIGALYAWSVFAAPMAEHLSQILGKELTAADLSVVFSVGNGLGFLTMIGGGFLNQKIGPKWVIFAGGILFGFGFLICGFASNLPMLVVGYGLFSGLAMGLAYGCTISNSVKFFPDKAGLVGGTATASYGISSVLVPPAANALIEGVGVSRAFIVMGVVIIVTVGIFSQMIVKCPDGFVPEGWTPPAVRTDSGLNPQAADRNWKEMLRAPVFYLMIVMLFFGAVLGMMAISQASNIAQDMIGMTPAAAAIVVSVLALFNTFGRILAGMVSDRIGCIQTLRAVFAAAILSMGILYMSGNGSAGLFYVGICLVGVCFGSFMGVYPSFTAERFGSKYSSVNYGIMFIGFNGAGLLGPMIVSWVFHQTGGYRGAFLIALGFAVLGFLLSFAIRSYDSGSGACS
ncbi:MAG: OFA family MFS transporter [Lachnospiraceae bacterium]|nr:OFA family MFS transporter [Lachnospiraceae bacterium]